MPPIEKPKSDFPSSDTLKAFQTHHDNFITLSNICRTLDCLERRQISMARCHEFFGLVFPLTPDRRKILN